MSDNWFYGNFNLIDDNFFDETKFKTSLNDATLNQPLTDIGLDDGQVWDAEFQPPPAMFYGDACTDEFEEKRIDSLRNWSVSSGESAVVQEEKTANGDNKDGVPFQTCSPVSVLESSGGSCVAGTTEKNPSGDAKLTFLVKRGRSKRKRAKNFSRQLAFVWTLTASGAGAVKGSGSDNQPAEKPLKQYKRRNQEWRTAPKTDPQVARKCSHCGTTKTPQWRLGPNGPKTLCNACGVRFRSGRLVPEYRPAASPTFVPMLHSNSHKRIVEMRRKAERKGAGAGAGAAAAAWFPY